MNKKILTNYEGHVKILILPALMITLYQLTDILILSIFSAILLWVFLLILLTRAEDEDENEDENENENEEEEEEEDENEEEGEHD